MTRDELIDALHAANELDDAFADSHDVASIATNVARACVPLLGHVVFFDLCANGEFASRAGAAYAAGHRALGAAIEAHAANRAWRTCVEHVVTTRCAVFDPSSALAWSTSSVLGSLVVPLAARGKVFGALGAVREGRLHSAREVAHAHQIARRTARAIDGVR